MSDYTNEEVEAILRENEHLQKKLDRKEPWIEKDEALIARDTEARLVTVNDLADPAFKKKYPDAKIGDELNDPVPLRWKIGLKRKPVLEERNARIAAQIGRDYREELSEEEELFDEDDYQEDLPTEAEFNSMLQAAAYMDAQIAAQSSQQGDKASSLPPAKQSDEVASGGVATAKQEVPSSDSEPSSES